MIVASSDELRNVEWVIVTAMAVGFMVIAGIALVRRWHTNYPQSGSSGPSDLTLPSDTPSRTYPSLPGDIRNLPEWITTNAPFDVGAAFAPVQTEQNAAPLYLDALYEFLPIEMDACISPAERRSRSRVLKERYTRSNYLQSQAPQTVTRDERSEVVAEYVESFAKLVRAQERELCIFEAPPGIESASVPHAMAARAVMRLVVWRTEIALAKGQADAAIDDIELLLRLSRDLMPRGNMIAQLAALTVETTALQSCIPQILNAPELKARHCDRLMISISHHVTERIDGLSEGARYEYAYTRDLLHRLELKEEIGAMVGAPGSSYGTLVQNTRKAVGADSEVASQIDENLASMNSGDFAAEVESLNRWTLIVLGSAGHLDQALPELTLAMRDSKILRYSNATFEACLEAFRRNRTRVSGTRCLVALRRWKLEHANANPPDLLTLCQAAEMGSIPLDEYSGEPLRFVARDGEFLIYSVGADGKDDKAQLDWKMGAQPGDWIFRLAPVP